MKDDDRLDTPALITDVYKAIHLLARRRMAREGAALTLQPTALVNEVYLRLAQDGSRTWESRGHFFAAAAEAMRRILVEHARARQAEKRGGGERPVPLEQPDLAFVLDHGLDDTELLDLHDALNALEAEARRHALVVKLKFFVGMTAPEIAEAIGVSVPTVDRDWAVARAWLKDRMTHRELE